MFKPLVLSLLLLWPWGFAEANMVQGNPPTPPPPPPSACSAAPDPAKAAGFTNNVLCSDFSDSFHSTISNWLDCDQSGWHPANPEFYEGRPLFNNGSPCNFYSMVIDTDGQRSFREQMSAALFATTASGTAPGAEVSTVANDRVRGKFFAMFYAKARMRVENIPDNGIYDATAWSAGLFGPAPEWDGIEVTLSFISDDCWHNPGGDNQNAGCNWISQNPVGLSGYNQYFDVAWRVTSDGNTMNMCAWVNDVAQGCQQVGNFQGNQLSGGSDIQTALEMSLGVDSSRINGDGSTVNVYFRSYEAWVCPGWPSDPCLTSNPNP